MAKYIIAFILDVLAGAAFLVVVDYLEAKNELAYCVEAEGASCQIEYDGIIGGFNVYWRGE